jgi:hypothetical protein
MTLCNRYANTTGMTPIGKLAKAGHNPFLNQLLAAGFEARKTAIGARLCRCSQAAAPTARNVAQSFDL